MSEPEDLIIDGAHRATRLAREAWQRYGPPPTTEALPLASVRARLELFVTALFGMPAEITAAEPAAPLSWLGRLAHPSAPRVGRQQIMASNDGRRIRLPPSLMVMPGAAESDALDCYRLLAVEQAARLKRHTTCRWARLPDPEARDRFLIAEAAEIDRWIARELPGLAGTLAAFRAQALRERPRTSRLTVQERLVENQLRDALTAAEDAAAPSPATDALERAPGAPRDADRQSRRRARWGSSRYRAVAPVWHWGVPVDESAAIRAADRTGDETTPTGRQRPPRVAEMSRRPRPRNAADDEDDERPGTWIVRADDPQESVEDPFGLQRPMDREQDADPEGLGDSLSELPEARVVRSPAPPREVLRSGEPLPQLETTPPPASGQPAGVVYPEWDCRIGQYRTHGATVRLPAAPLGDPEWVVSALSRQGRLARRVRVRFERLRPRHVRVGRQPDGSDIDLDAWVTLAADMRAGGTIDGRLYSEQRPNRRELTVALLVDVSASTDGWVSGDRRIVEVEKEALLVVCEALDALGDPYGIFAFSGEGPHDVSVLALKPFQEANGPVVRRRIAALEADRYTRMGTAVRHVTAEICRQHARGRLLLILSDGKPNDVDVYEGRYGVEDARQAVAEARRQGVTVFCLTVDREAPRYASRLFGPGGYAVLRRPDQLPAVLIEALRQLIRT